MSQRVRFCRTFPSQQASHVPNEDGSHDRRILPIRFAAVGRTEADRLSVDALITPGIPVERRTCLYRGNNNLQHRARLVLLIPARLVNGLHVNIRGCWTNRSGLDFLFFSFVSFFFFSFLFFFECLLAAWQMSREHDTISRNIFLRFLKNLETRIQTLLSRS